MHSLIFGIVLLTVVPTAMAQVTGPYLGFVLDHGVEQFRVLPGTPSVAQVGPVMDFGHLVGVGAYSPDGRYVAIQSGPSALAIHGATGTVSLPTVDSFDAIALSPRGERAILFDRVRGHLIAVAGLPDTGYIAGRIALPLHYGVLTAAVVSDTGTVLTAYESGIVLRLEARALQTRRFARFDPVGSFGRVTAMAFLRGEEDVLVADDANDTVSVIRNVGGTPARSVVASAPDGVDRPVAVAASVDGSRFFIADAGSAKVLVGRANDPAVTAIDCSCTPSALDALIGDSVFGLTVLDTGSAFWVLDGGSDPPRLRLVPRSETDEVAP